MSLNQFSGSVLEFLRKNQPSLSLQEILSVVLGGQRIDVALTKLAGLKLEDVGVLGAAGQLARRYFKAPADAAKHLPGTKEQKAAMVLAVNEQILVGYRNVMEAQLEYGKAQSQLELARGTATEPAARAAREAAEKNLTAAWTEATRIVGRGAAVG